MWVSGDILPISSAVHDAVLDGHAPTSLKFNESLVAFVELTHVLVVRIISRSAILMAVVKCKRPGRGVGRWLLQHHQEKRYRKESLHSSASIAPTKLSLMKKLLALLLLVSSLAFGNTVTGVIQTATGGPVANGTLTLTPSQAFVIAGTATVVSSPIACYTDANGNVVGEPNPLVAPVVTPNTSSGTLAAGTYLTRIVYQDASGTSFYSPETTTVLASTGSLIVTAPVKQPATATGYQVSISLSPSAETLQGTITGTPGTWGNYTQSSALAAGAALPASNTTACKPFFNDQGSPVGGYNVTLTTASGSTVAGFPQRWQLFGGAAGTVNLSNGTPLWNGFVQYPQAIIASPAFNATQSIAGGLSLGGFPIIVGGITDSGNLSATGNGSIGGTFSVTGASSFAALTASGNVTEVAGQNQYKAYSFDSVLWVDGIKYTTLAACYADIPSTGGVCNVPPNYTETLAASITMSKNGAGFAFQGPAVITMGSNRFIISAGTSGAFITGPMDQGGQSCTALPCTTYTNSTELIYTGNSAAILVGAATPQTQHAKIRGLFINLAGAGNAAIGVDVIATAGHFDISQNLVVGSGGAPNTQIGLLLDGGGTTFTCDGEIDENEVINTLIGIKTANMSCENVYKGNQIACNPGSTPATIGMDFEDNTFGNTILGGNFSACAVIWKVAGTANANYGIFPVNQETTDATFAAGTSMNVAIFLPQVGGGSNNPPVVTDAGTNNQYSTGVTAPTRAYVRAVSAVAAIGTTTIFTTQATNTMYRFDIALACDSASAAATVAVTVKFTDPSNTVQTLTSIATAACNALGTSSVASTNFPFIAKGSTAVQYSTTIANTPTYDLRIAVTQLGTN